MAPLVVAMAQTKSALTFFSLPPELRLIIYSHIIDEHFAASQALSQDKKVRRKRIQLKLIAVSHQMRLEAFQVWSDRIWAEREAAFQRMELALRKLQQTDRPWVMSECRQEYINAVEGEAWIRGLSYELAEVDVEFSKIKGLRWEVESELRRWKMA